MLALFLWSPASPTPPPPPIKLHHYHHLHHPFVIHSTIYLPIISKNLSKIINIHDFSLNRCPLLLLFLFLLLIHSFTTTTTSTTTLSYTAHSSYLLFTKTVIVILAYLINFRIFPINRPPFLFFFSSSVSSSFYSTCAPPPPPCHTLHIHLTHYQQEYANKLDLP